MNKRDRLEAAIHGAKVDRVPVALWRHWPGDDQRADDQAAAHMAFQAEYDWDFVKVTPSSSFCLDGWGVADRWEGNTEGTRKYLQWAVQSPDDWVGLQPLSPYAGGLGRQLDCLKLLEKTFGTATPFIQTIFSPLAQAKNLAGEDALILHLRQHASQVRQALAAITETTLAFISEARQTGIAGIFYAVQHASYQLLTEAEYAEFGRPYDLRILSAVSDLWLNVLHLHGNNVMFRLLADYPVQAVNWHDREGWPLLAEGLPLIAGAASGGVSRETLHDEDPEQAVRQARDAFEQTQGVRWILGTGCVSLITTPTGNIRKLRALADQLSP